MGTRLRPLTDSTPKPLLKVGGRSLLSRHLYALQQAGINDVVINVHHLGEQIMHTMGDGSEYGVKITYSIEPELLETAGGIRAALHHLVPGPFLVISGDVYTNFDFSQLTAVDDATALLVMVPNPEHHPQGDFAIGARGILDTTGHKLTYSGIGLFSESFFRNSPNQALKLRELLIPAIQRRQVRGVRFDGIWEDVGTVDRLDKLNQADS
jgi:MurNAc alpha-1-phosphate uridylyltransferase